MIAMRRVSMVRLVRGRSFPPRSLRDSVGGHQLSRSSRPGAGMDLQGEANLKYAMDLLSDRAVKGPCGSS